MYALTQDDLMHVCGGSEASYAAGQAAGHEVGQAVMKVAKIAGTVSDVIALAAVIFAASN